MATTGLINSGAGETTSSEFTVAAGANVLLALKNYDSDANVHVELKSDDGGFVTVGNLNSRNLDTISCLLSGPGTYRLRRAPKGSCGAFQVT